MRAPAEHGEERVREALEACLGDGGRSDELAFRRSLAGARERREVAVPEALRGYRVERVGVEASHRGQLQLAAVRLEHGRASRVVHGAAAASRRS